MSMRPVDLQTVVPRVAETARVERAGQQGQEKAAAQAASQNQEAARKGHEEVPQTQQADLVRVARDRKGGDRGGQGGKRRGRSDGAQPDESRQEPEAAPAPPLPQEPGGRLDLRM